MGKAPFSSTGFFFLVKFLANSPTQQAGSSTQQHFRAWSMFTNVARVELVGVVVR
jgi:hypothetical protein